MCWESEGISKDSYAVFWMKMEQAEGEKLSRARKYFEGEKMSDLFLKCIWILMSFYWTSI